MTTIDLKQFCARSDLRLYLNQPWNHGGFRYGCNGHILIRVPTEAPDDAETHSLTHKAAELVKAAGKAAYISLPPFKQPTRCLGCEGDGQRLAVACEDCHGDGTFEHGHHEYQCKECDGDGLLDARASEPGATMHDCPECGGAGFHHSGAPVGDANYSTVYLRLISLLPNPRICTNGREKAAHFTFDGGEGLLMPRMAD